MTEQTKPAFTMDQFKQRFTQANDRQQAMMRFAAAIAVLRKSKAPEDVVTDAYMAAIVAFASELQLSVLMHIIETSDKTRAPAEAIVGSMALQLIDKAEADNRKLVNIMTLVTEKSDHTEVAGTSE